MITLAFETINNNFDRFVLENFLEQVLYLVPHQFVQSTANGRHRQLINSIGLLMKIKQKKKRKYVNSSGPDHDDRWELNQQSN